MPDKNVKGKCARVAHFADFAVLSENSQVSTSDLSRKAQTVPRLSHGVTIRYTKCHPFGKHQYCRRKRQTPFSRENASAREAR